MATKYVHRQADVSADAFPHRSIAAGLMVDSDDDKLKYNPDGTVREILDSAHSFTLTGAQTFSGAVTLSGTLVQTGAVTSNRASGVNLAAATQTLTAAQSGQTFVGALDAVFTLPLTTAGAGIHYYIVTGAASGGTGLRVTAVTPDEIFGAAVDTGAAGSITNSGATDVIGDNLHLVSDGAGQWIAVSARGTWA